MNKLTTSEENMKEYTVDIDITLAIPITVEADNLKEAKEKAKEVAHSSHHYGEAVRNVVVDPFQTDF